MAFFLFCDDNGEVISEIPVSNAEKVFRALDADGEPSTGDEKRVVETRRNGTRYVTAHSIKKKRGKPDLSWREEQVLEGLCNALSPGQIAVSLGIQVRTIRKHLDGLKKKFQAESRDQMIARAGFLGYCDPYIKDPSEWGNGNGGDACVAGNTKVIYD